MAHNACLLRAFCRVPSFAVAKRCVVFGVTDLRGYGGSSVAGSQTIWTLDHFTNILLLVVVLSTPVSMVLMLTLIPLLVMTLILLLRADFPGTFFQQALHRLLHFLLGILVVVVVATLAAHLPHHGIDPALELATWPPVPRHRRTSPELRRRRPPCIL